MPESLPMPGTLMNPRKTRPATLYENVRAKLVMSSAIGYDDSHAISKNRGGVAFKSRVAMITDTYTCTAT